MPSPFCCLGFSLVLFYILRCDSVEGNRVIQGKSFWQGAWLERGNILLFLPIRFSSFYFAFSLPTIGSVSSSHFCSWYHTFDSCPSVTSGHLSISLSTLLWPHFMISSAVFSFLYLYLHKFTFIPEYIQIAPAQTYTLFLSHNLLFSDNSYVWLFFLLSRS